MADIVNENIFEISRASHRLHYKQKTFHSQNTGYYACITRQKQSLYHMNVPVGTVANCIYRWTVLIEGDR